jgi:hypothetical protein
MMPPTVWNTFDIGHAATLTKRVRSRVEMISGGRAGGNKTGRGAAITCARRPRGVR